METNYKVRITGKNEMNGEEKEFTKNIDLEKGAILSSEVVEVVLENKAREEVLSQGLVFEGFEIIEEPDRADSIEERVRDF